MWFTILTLFIARGSLGVAILAMTDEKRKNDTNIEVKMIIFPKLTIYTYVCTHECMYIYRDINCTVWKGTRIGSQKRILNSFVLSQNMLLCHSFPHQMVWRLFHYQNETLE